MTSRLVLSFDLTAHSLAYTDDMAPSKTPEPYLSVEAWPHANGIAIIRQPSGYVCDALSILGHGLENCAFDIYTCSCGVAGCAGLHEQVRQEADEHEVRWIFPKHTFQSELNPELGLGDGPLVLRFDRKQYLEALADLESRILALADGSDLPVALPPYSYPDLETPVRQAIAESREHIGNWLDNERHTKVIFGRLIDMDVSVEYPCGGKFRMPITQLAYEIASQVASSRDLDEYDDILEEETLPAFLASDDAIIAAARSLTWTDARKHIWMDRNVEQNGVLPTNQAAQAYEWKCAHLSVVPASITD